VTITNDLLGHGVNIAARLQSLAVPNTALVSGEFRSMARSSPSVAFQAKGRQPLDNINQRVQTFAILSGAQRARRVAIKAAASLAAVAILGALAFFGGQVEQFVQSTGVLQMAGLAPAKPPAEAEAAVAPVPAPEPVPVVTPPPAPAIVRKAGEIFHDCDGCPDMIVVPGGSFIMGSTAKEKPRFPNEGPQREVMLKPFAVSIYETTFNDWDACVADGQCGGFKPADLGWGRGRRPVVGVSWDDAQSYVAWLNTKAGKPLYRLLSEAEWEYLARAGSATPFGPVEKMTRATANYGSGRSDPAGSYAANPFGLYDISGNASEWVADCYVATYEGAPADGRAVAPETCKARVYRGGSYSDAAPALRVADRKKAAPDLRAPNLGFRIARELE
jgi:formylglycine-generating enzyme required for sulfatase activity